MWRDINEARCKYQCSYARRTPNPHYWSRTTNSGGSHLTLGPQTVHTYCAWFSTFTAMYGDEGFCDDKWAGAKKIRRHALTELPKKYYKTPRQAILPKRKLVFWRCQGRISTETLLIASVVVFFSSSRKLRDSRIKRDQLDVTCFFISLFNAQHVSDVNTSILRSLRLICWVISWVVLLWYDACWCYVVVLQRWCGIRMQAEDCIRIFKNTCSRIQLLPIPSLIPSESSANETGNVV